MTAFTTPATTEREVSVLWIRLALVVALVGLVGSLYLSINMGLKACPLCLYQRTFVMAAAAVLLLAPFLRGLHADAVAPLTLPMAAGGLGVALFHSYLEASAFLECPPGVFGLGSAPQQSLAIFGLLTLLLLIDLFLRWSNFIPGVAALLLGVLFTFAAIRSAPPAPLPTAPYPLPIEEDGCRRPYVPQ